MLLELSRSFACIARPVLSRFDMVSWVFIEIDLNIGFPMFSRVVCLVMPYRGYGCIPCFIPVYGSLVFELVSGV